jgi:hypothetical protein
MSGSSGDRNDSNNNQPPARPVPRPKGDGHGGVGAADDPCAIFQKAPLNSPKPAIVTAIKIGDVLRVVLNETSGRPILEVHSGAGVAGALTHNGHLQLVDCIRKGRSYSATVAGIRGGAVDLEISPI